ncbi:hypothetical protein KY285_024002 [Solanum tuberosum]|nr:hypothetical protein KY289_024360 [Solanum tuberosum]KAH0676201.1 hypothetical protein KY285_024002 [Solanum tuberosum]
MLNVPVEANSTEELKLSILTILFSDTYDYFLPNINFVKQEENKKELITLGLLEWNKSRVTAEILKYRKKVPKIMNPGHIQVPR